MKNFLIYIAPAAITFGIYVIFRCYKPSYPTISIPSLMYRFIFPFDKVQIRRSPGCIFCCAFSLIAFSFNCIYTIAMLLLGREVDSAILCIAGSAFGIEGMFVGAMLERRIIKLDSGDMWSRLRRIGELVISLFGISIILAGGFFCVVFLMYLL